MKEMQRIKRMVMLLLKGMPIILACFLAGLYIARKAIQYSVPKYQSIAKIKLDDRKYGMSANNLYEDFDVFSSENKIETEAEILKSPLLIGQTIDAMELGISVSRVGRMKTTALHEDNPFIFHVNEESEAISDQKFLLEVNGDHLAVTNEDEVLLAQGMIGESFDLLGESVIIDRNEALLAQKKITTNGTYQFEIRSRNAWIAFLSEQLDVKAIDKEIPVLRVVVKSEDPQFAADFANKLCAVYVEDYISTKSSAATKTLSFIDERMTSLQVDLNQSENSLERYKIDHDVVNTRQETETGLREISKLKLQLINLEMEEKAIIELESYISQGDYYEKTAINFGFGDLLLTELVKKLKLYTDEKRDLMVKYTENDERVVNVQGKIDDIENYIKEAILQNKNNIQTKRTEIELKMVEMNSRFDDIPTREKEMRILERDFQINETVYTFLAQKKLEAQIASSALMSFHRVIQPAIPATRPVSPNKVLITFVSGFLGLIGGILIVIGLKTVSGKITTRADVERLTSTPVVAALGKRKDSAEAEHDFASLINALRLHNQSVNQTIVVTSSVQKEGKSYVAFNLAHTYNKMGYTVAVLDFNPFNPTCAPVDYTCFFEDLLSNPDAMVPEPTGHICKIGLRKTGAKAGLTLGHKNMSLTLEALKARFDYLIVDTPGSIISIDALALLRHAQVGLYVVKAKHSKAEYITNVDVIQDEYGFENMKIVLNAAGRATNYSGIFNSARLRYTKLPKGIANRLRHYFSTYSA